MTNHLPLPQTLIILSGLPAAKSNVPLTLRFEPDLGLILLVILLLTVGWGSVRSLWAIRRWQASN